MTPRARKDGRLTDDQVRELLDHDPTLFGRLYHPTRSAFRSKASKKAAWEANTGELTEEYARARPGRRPLAWWRWSAPDDLPTPDHADPRDPSRPAWPHEDTALGWFLAPPDVQAAYLHRHGLLFSHETTALRAREKA